MIEETIGIDLFKKLFVVILTDNGSKFSNPLERLYAHFTYVPLNENKMQEAAKYLIGEHDFQVKVKGAVKFLQDGDKVKVTVRFGGREMNHTSDGEVLIDRFADTVKEYGVMDKRPKLEGKRMSVIISPK